jgi:hypothetical protein
MKNKQRTAVASDEEAQAPTPLHAQLTNKAGATALPLESDVEAWLKIGWYRV